jgi:CubicO group peptidase (beta-lactamase class C family)
MLTAERTRAHIDAMLTEAGATEGTTTVAVSRGGRYGEATVVDGAPSTAQPFFQLGSISKFLTAIACVTLEREGTLSLDEPLRDTAGFDALHAAAPDGLRIRDILEHRSGLNVWSFPGYRRDEDTPSLEDIVAGRGASPPLAFVAEPRDRTKYSSGAFALLQAAVEDRMGEPAHRAIPAALRRVAPTARIFGDQRGPHPHDAARGMVHRCVPTPLGSLHFPETCSQGLWSRARDLVEVLAAFTADLVDPRFPSRARPNSWAWSVMRPNSHPRMRLSVLVDSDSAGNIYLHHQGHNLGYAAEFRSYPTLDTHVVGCTSAPITSNELSRIVASAAEEATCGHPAAVAPPRPEGPTLACLR